MNPQSNKKTKFPYHLVIRTWLSQKPKPVSFILSFVLILVCSFVSFALWTNNPFVENWLTANGHLALEKHQYWRLWTTIFAHADMKHLLSNSLFLFVFAGFIHSYYGKFAALFMPLLAGGAINYFTLSAMPSNSFLIGISGVVFWLGGFWIGMYFFLDKKRTPLKRALRVFGLSLVLFFPSEAFDPQISYRAHLLGFCGGITFALIWFALHKKQYECYLLFKPDEDALEFASKTDIDTFDHQTGPSSRFH